MFDSLQDGLQSALKSLSGKGKLTEANMRDGLRIVEEALIEADVSYSVVQDFMAKVTEVALGQKVLKSLNPQQQLLGAVNEQLIALLGPVDSSLHLTKDVTVLMMCGLQGAGKTTTCGKLSRLIAKEGKNTLLVGADLQRPAAVEQLKVIGDQVGVPVYSEDGATDPIAVCRNAVEHARANGIHVVILDTAGRLAIDEELMEQLKTIDRQVGPDQVYLVVDGMTGQDAVNSAAVFNEALELDGVIMTKLDGDARGGALISVKHVTGVPIKFIGVSEHMDGLETFTPEGMASRILGQGDIGALINIAQDAFDEDTVRQAQENLEAGQFTLDDFRKQLEQMAKPGLMQKMMGLMPGMGDLNKMMGEANPEGEMKRTRGIIDSMTKKERFNPKLIDSSRRQRIAKGAGVSPQDVNELLKQFDGMASMMKSMQGQGAGGQMEMLRKLQSGGMMDAAGGIKKTKVGTGKRLSASDKKNQKKKRASAQKRRKRK